MKKSEKIIYSSHIKFRLKVRGIPKAIPKSIFLTSQEHYLDIQTRKNIAVKKISHKGKIREMAVIYERAKASVILITIHPLKLSQKSHRIKSLRWQKI